MPTTIPNPPATPLRAEGPTLFNAKAGPFVDWLVIFTTAMNTMIAEIAAYAAAALGYATSASSSASAASGYATQTGLDAATSTSAVAVVIPARDATIAAYNATVSALSSVALSEDWGLVTEAVTVTVDYGTL